MKRRGIPPNRRAVREDDRSLEINEEDWDTSTGPDSEDEQIQAPPIPLLNFMGADIPPDHRDIRKQEEIDQTKYPRLAANIQTDGWLPLIDASYEDEQTAESTLSKELTRLQWVWQCDEALAGIHDQVLAAYMTGNPTQMAAADPQGLGKALREYSERSAEHPSIYVRHLTVGPNHDNLTADEALRLAPAARQYANMQSDKWKEARTIDKALYGRQWKAAWSKQGLRALIHNSNGLVSSMKQHVMQTWADALERIARQAKKDERSHIRSLYYVGYSINAQKRNEDHERTDNSINNLIRFTTAVLETSSWSKNSPVHTSTQAICLLSGEKVAAVAEALLARLTCSYHFSGGFNMQPCGIVHSVYATSIPPDEEEALWMRNREWLDTRTDYSAYKQQETRRREALQRRPWEQEKSELLRRRQEGVARMEELRKARDEIYEQMDWEIVKEDEFFKEYIDMFNDLSAFVDKNCQR